MVGLGLVGVGLGEVGHGAVEAVPGAQVAADGRGVAAAGVGPGQDPAAQPAVGDEIGRVEVSRSTEPFMSQSWRT